MTEAAGGRHGETLTSPHHAQPASVDLQDFYKNVATPLVVMRRNVL
jgi:hypothetical protein